VARFLNSNSPFADDSATSSTLSPSTKPMATVGSPVFASLEKVGRPPLSASRLCGACGLSCPASMQFCGHCGSNMDHVQVRLFGMCIQLSMCHPLLCFCCVPRVCVACYFRVLCCVLVRLCHAVVLCACAPVLQTAPQWRGGTLSPASTSNNQQYGRHQSQLRPQFKSLQPYQNQHYRENSVSSHARNPSALSLASNSTDNRHLSLMTSPGLSQNETPCLVCGEGVVLGSRFCSSCGSDVSVCLPSC
jgi:hypothetical protein